MQLAPFHGGLCSGKGPSAARSRTARCGIDTTPGSVGLALYWATLYAGSRARSLLLGVCRRLIHDTTHVRCMPCEGSPTAEEQEGEVFAPLRELCTAAGPPFMETAGDRGGEARR